MDEKIELESLEVQHSQTESLLSVSPLITADEKGKYEPPKAQGSDKALAVLRAATGSIPVIGNAVNELMPLLITAPLERRRQDWMNQVGAALSELENIRSVTLVELQSDPRFISVFVQATQVAMRNHQQEKIHALKQAVSHSARGVKIDEDLQLLFIRFIDELTPSHLALLRFFQDQEAHFEDVNSYEELFQAFASTGTKITRDQFRLICEELKTRNLVRISDSVDDFAGVATNNYLTEESGTPGPVLLITEIGSKMLKFISDESRENLDHAKRSDN